MLNVEIDVPLGSPVVEPVVARVGPDGRQRAVIVGGIDGRLRLHALDGMQDGWPRDIGGEIWPMSGADPRRLPAVDSGPISRLCATPLLIMLMMLLGIGGGTAMPSATSLLLNTVPADKSGTASGVLNTARQVGGLLAIALFGALITAHGYDQGLRLSLSLAAGLILLTLAAAWRLRPAVSPREAAEAG